MLKMYGLIAALVGVSILADYFLKTASERPSWLAAPEFGVGALLYGSTAIGWVLAMQHMKLGTIAVVYSSLTLVLLAALGVAVFGERLNGREILGIGLALAALGLMHSSA
jgi:undecaprenyl phosphate-alpha-L-ara4N flippase subunit ArnF